MGILVKAPEGAKVCQDFRAHFGIEKWEPEAEKEPVERVVKRSGSWWSYAWLRIKQLVGLAPPKPPVVPVYDIEGIRKHMNVLRDGEEVVLTEKIHGRNARYIHTGKKFYVGSRTKFRNKVSSVPGPWHIVAQKYNLESIMAQYPGMVLFGEIYGDVQDLKYGVPASEDVRFVVFDVMSVVTPGKRKYLSYGELRHFCSSNDLLMVPELYVGPWDKSLVSHAEGKTTMPGANHVREGFVVKPTTERHDPHFGRVILKLPGEGYWHAYTNDVETIFGESLNEAVITHAIEFGLSIGDRKGVQLSDFHEIPLSTMLEILGDDEIPTETKTVGEWISELVGDGDETLCARCICSKEY
jgi:hypothetical protein